MYARELLDDFVLRVLRALNFVHAARARVGLEGDGRAVKGVHVGDEAALLVERGEDAQQHGLDVEQERPRAEAALARLADGEAGQAAEVRHKLGGDLFALFVVGDDVGKHDAEHEEDAGDDGRKERDVHGHAARVLGRRGVQRRVGAQRHGRKRQRQDQELQPQHQPKKQRQQTAARRRRGLRRRRRQAAQVVLRRRAAAHAAAGQPAQALAGKKRNLLASCCSRGALMPGGRMLLPCSFCRARRAEVTVADVVRASSRNGRKLLYT